MEDNSGNINKVMKIISNEYIPPDPLASEYVGEGPVAIGKRHLLLKCIHFGIEFVKMVDVSGEWIGFDHDNYDWYYDTDENGNRLYEINIICDNNPNLTMADVADL